MSILSSNDLQYSYSGTTTPGDNAKLRGHPDRDELNRHEKYEMLSFLNWFATVHNLTKAAALKAERLIHQHLPSDLRSRAHVADWLVRNWKLYS